MVAIVMPFLAFCIIFQRYRTLYCARLTVRAICCHVSMCTGGQVHSILFEDVDDGHIVLIHLSVAKLSCTQDYAPCCTTFCYHMFVPI